MLFMFHFNLTDVKKLYGSYYIPSIIFSIYKYELI